MGRSYYHLAGDMARAVGDVVGAEVAYQRARRVQRTADIRIALGDLYRDEGRLLDAEVEYRAAWRKEKLYIAASARVGDILRRQDKHEQAREAFEGNHVAEQAVLDWSWRHLQTPAAQHIEVGEGLDFGYIGGMYPAEQVQGTWARWTDGRGLFRLIIPVEDDMPRLHPETPHPPVLVLRLAAPHPDTEGITARVCAAGRCQPVPLDTTWRTVKLLLPGVRPDNATSGSAERVVKLHSPTFAAPDGRRLGVLVDRATVYP
jgi:hypothetical protein